jgi:hypothetical protein
MSIARRLERLERTLHARARTSKPCLVCRGWPRIHVAGEILWEGQAEDGRCTGCGSRPLLTIIEEIVEPDPSRPGHRRPVQPVLGDDDPDDEPPENSLDNKPTLAQGNFSC